MNFETHNTTGIDVGGTSLQGYVTADYASLVAKFGPALNGGDGYKTDAEWELRFADGTIATIYNWKDGFNYLGDDEGQAVEDITDWHIGGRDERAVTLVKQALALAVAA